MRTFVFSCLLLALLPSCKEESKKIHYIWTGQEELRHSVPACIIWYKKVPPPLDAWKPYKCFSQADANDMRSIILLLTIPESKELNPRIKTEDKLSLIFYNGFPEKLTVREVYFVMQDHTFIGPLGKSDNLARILLNKQEVRPLFYYAYSELDECHYLDDFERILQINQSNQNLGEDWRRIRRQEENQRPGKE